MSDATQQNVAQVLRDSGYRRVVATWVAATALIVLAAALAFTNWRYLEDRHAAIDMADAATVDRDRILGEIEATEQELVCFAARSTEFFVVVSDLLTYQLTSPGEALTPEQQVVLDDALARLAEFRAEAAAGTLTCPSP
jgi:hypothetical protein